MAQALTSPEKEQAGALLFSQSAPLEQQVVIGEEIGSARLMTLNRPRQLNGINSRMVYLLTQFLERWEKDDDAKLVIVKGSGRAFSAGGDLRMFYEGRSEKDRCLEVAYKMYWLCYHIHTYKKPTVALAHGIVIGGGGSLVTPLRFSVVTDKTFFSLPEASIGLHTDCSFSYILPRLPGHLGEFLGLTGTRLNGKDIVAVGLATHIVPSEKLKELEKRLLSLNSGDEALIRATIEEYSSDVKGEEGILNKLSTINKCFSAETVEEITKLLEAEAIVNTSEWIPAALNGLKKSSPTSLKITLKSIREGRKQTLSECLRKEFRITMNLLRSVINDDVYEGIRALSIDKDNAPKWSPSSLEEVSNEKINLVFEPFGEKLDLWIPTGEACRWEGKYENSVYPDLKANKFMMEQEKMNVLN